MGRLRWLAIWIAALSLGGTAGAQQVVLRGWVQGFDPQTFALLLRTTGNPRWVLVDPSAVVTLKESPTPVAEIPLNSFVEIDALKSWQGVTQATRIAVLHATDLPPVGRPVGSFVQGTVLEVDYPANLLRLRAPAGEVYVPLGTAPILINGRHRSIVDLQPGDRVEVERRVPSLPGGQYLTQRVTVTERASGD
jgi:hypothetical protein